MQNIKENNKFISVMIIEKLIVLTAGTAVLDIFDEWCRYFGVKKK
jgi:hypothetical protein